MLVQVIAHARRRLWWNALLFQLTVAATVGLLVLVLMLLLGTDVIAARWPVLLPLTCLAAGIWLAWRRLPAFSPTAEFLDRRLKLPDTLATALFFSSPHPERSCGEEFPLALRTQAARIAEGVNLREVVPVKMPRSVLFPALLAVAAASLFVVRYQSAARLDLKEPMGIMLRQLMEGARSEVARLVEELKPARILERMKGEEARKSTPSPDGESADGKPPGPGDSNSSERGSAATAEQEKPKPDTFAGEREPREGEPKQGDQVAADSQSGAARSGTERQGKEGSQQQQQQQQGAGNQTASSSGGSGMVNKVKDALANLMSALKPPSGAAGGQQAMNGQDNRASGNNQKKGAADAGSASGEKGEGESSKPGNAMAGGAGQSGESQAEKLQGTGAGNNEGSKEIRTAEQLEAMGKLDRVFGKRAENVSGEMTVQAPPGPQNLRTPYAQREAEHSSVETTAMRDEVPVAFQDYVQHYYDLLRREEASTRRQGRVMATARKSRTVR
uniref:Uncharacterized protein n=1 Tax=Solibacter usitatus (strain Ellin6076) TaxID=234267 RepID=Q021M4_SOLUE